MEYKLIIDTITYLQHRIPTYIKRGWELHGAPFLYGEERYDKEAGGGPVFAQALIREEKEEPPP